MRINCPNACKDGQRSRATQTRPHPTRGRSCLRVLSPLLALLVLTACNAGNQPAQSPLSVAAGHVAAAAAKPEESRMWMSVGEYRFAITLNDNPAARAFADQLPLTLDMAELNGNEMHAALPKALPTNPSQPGAIRNGDLMLYGPDTLVIFYLAFESSYSYTRLGRVDDPAGLAQTLGRRGVRVIFSKD